MVAVVQTSYRGYKTPQKVVKSNPIASKPTYEHTGDAAGWSRRLTRASLRAKELLQKDLLPVVLLNAKRMGSKLFDVAKKGLSMAGKALADGSSADSSASTRGTGLNPSLATKKSSLSRNGKKLISAIDKLYKTEKQIKKETAQNTKINARKALTPQAPPPQPVAEAATTPHDPTRLVLQHPDSLRIAVPDAPVETQTTEITLHARTPGAIPKKSLLFGAKDLQSVKLKGVLKGTTSSSKRRVSFGENNFKTISPRPSPQRTAESGAAAPVPLTFTAQDLQQVALHAATEPHQQHIVEAAVQPAPALAIGFSAADLQGVKLKPVCVAEGEKSISISSSSSDKGVTASALKAIMLKPLTQRLLPRPESKKRPFLTLEDQLKQAFDQKFQKTRSPDNRDVVEEEEDADEWLA